MQRFSDMVMRLGMVENPQEARVLWSSYVSGVPPGDATQAAALLTGRRPGKLLPRKVLHEWALEQLRLPAWLIRESTDVVGSRTETIAILVAGDEGGRPTGLGEWIRELEGLRSRTQLEQKLWVLDSWKQLDAGGCAVMNTILSGSFRTRLPAALVSEVLSQTYGLDKVSVSIRLMEGWTGGAASIHEMLNQKDERDQLAHPYPFYRAERLEEVTDQLGSPQDWRAEWKWDGLRCQFILRNGQVFIWSQGGEIVNTMFPELTRAAEQLPDGTVLDGMVMAFHKRPLPARELLSRMEGTPVTDSLMKGTPVVFTAWDVLEHEGNDIRHLPWSSRRAVLEEISRSWGPGRVFLLSSAWAAGSWEALYHRWKEARTNDATGIMLKRTDAAYLSELSPGGWRAWSTAPLVINAVLLYASRSRGTSGVGFTEYTFGLWKGDNLVPVARLSAENMECETDNIDAYIQSNTVERFGPVSQVHPGFVCRLACDAVHPSKRHKCGVVLQHPRVLENMEGMQASDADHLDILLREAR